MFEVVRRYGSYRIRDERTGATSSTDRYGRPLTRASAIRERDRLNAIDRPYVPPAKCPACGKFTSPTAIIRCQCDH
jgi:hypothetical protein